ncbi:TadA family conjugal transfer-associated ATPase [Propioniciclava coleopterorum]|uniref:TadA family conjugal transfer-associated ATPase n=1 Tax=Propioniciclava coleopterorum TaxID=2714937 RepID=A0A6G7Y573_9ACTN|nr:TadA family conjugal transfer-associated ATPase [Propioniciclava coleopterorum]QIK71816.1 TadA family conjugal transfer-associated ATPase [Propioniciclava coleopterorum]
MTVDLDEVRARLSVRGEPARPAEVADALAWLGHVVSDDAVLSTVAALRRESEGAGAIDDLLRLPGVTDVLVNGPDEVWIDRGAGLERADVGFGTEEAVRRLAVRLAAQVGRRLDDASPFVDARMPDGTRVHAALACVAGRTCLSLRVPARVRMTLADWEARGSITSEGVCLLRRLVAGRAALLVSGGTGSGKTTLLAALLSEVSPSERLVIVEDSRELDPEHPHVVRLEGRVANAERAGGVALTELVRNALRMRPDRLIVGEVRGAELADLLAALNTGHEGGCGTVHANSAAAVPARLEALGALGGLARHALHAQAAAALDVVVHVRREPGGGRRVEQLAVLEPGADGLVRAVPAIAWGPDGVPTRGPAASRLERWS